MKSKPVWIFLLFILLIVVSALGIWVGSSGLGLPDFGTADDRLGIIMGVRLPRVLLAALVGAALASAGTAFQALLRNPLADPYIVGVSGGAALGGVLALAFGLQADWALPAFAFIGGTATTLLLYGFAASRDRSDPLTLLLLGVVFNSFAAAAITFIKSVVGAEKAQEILFWLMGNISVQPSSTLLSLTLYIALGLGILLSSAGALNLLALGDDDAAALGVNIQRTRLMVFLSAAFLVAAAVSAAGMIGFVGLVVPHILRLLGGADHRWLVPASILGGAAFLVLADTLARISFLAFTTQLPVGVVTAFAGGPFFILLLLRREA
ncbi:iron ABC transporter permease [Myxococcota bacterium]|nr:iron ABC transporter permease [Myxococcota bacterium]